MCPWPVRLLVGSEEATVLSTTGLHFAAAGVNLHPASLLQTGLPKLGSFECQLDNNIHISLKFTE